MEQNVHFAENQETVAFNHLNLNLFNPDAQKEIASHLGGKKQTKSNKNEKN